MILHVGAFQLNADRQRQTPWHVLAPQTRLLCTVMGVFAIAWTPHGRWETWGVYALGILLLIAIARVTLSTLMKRVSLEFAFASTVLLGTLFRSGGEILWRWGLLRITTDGLTVLGSVSLKMLLSLVLLNLLTLTTSIPALLNALVILRTPPLLVAILASMYRYLSVLIGEFNAMHRAAMSRNLLLNPRATRRIVGNTIGVLFIRTFDRGERIYQAMLARGYRGIVPLEKTPKLARNDIWAIAATLIWVVLGQAIAWKIGDR
jgi:cobalt/nickel transport system permease protein